MTGNSAKFLRLKDVEARVGLKRSTIYEYVDTQIFPRPVPLGARAIGWVEEEVIEWMEKRIAERDNKAKQGHPHYSPKSS